MDYIITDIGRHFNIDILKDVEYLSFNAFVIIICVLLFAISESSMSFRIKRTILILYMNVVYSMTVLMRIGSNAVREHENAFIKILIYLLWLYENKITKEKCLLQATQ
jgi:cobalamin synthase